MSPPYGVAPEALAELEAARAEARAEGEAEPRPEVERVEDVDAGGVPSRLYVPAGATAAVLYLHGGGFAMGELATHDAFVRRMAVATGWAVMMPDYRRSPEHPWPAAAEDASTAADWLSAHAEQAGLTRLAVVGDSAGSALAIGQVLRHPERWVAQVQVYPFVDPSCASYEPLPEATDLTVERCRLYWQLYLQGAAGDDALHVLEDGTLAGQPPALVQLAELDVLTPTGHRYAERLRAAGVEASVRVFPGVQHGFWRRTDNAQSGPALADVVSFLSAF